MSYTLLDDLLVYGYVFGLLEQIDKEGVLLTSEASGTLKGECRN